MEEGGGRGQKEKKGDTKRKRGRKRGMTKGRGERKRPEIERQGRECCQSEATICLYALGGNNEEGRGDNDSHTLPFGPSSNSYLNIHPPSPVANMPTYFDILPFKVIDIISF